MSMSLSAIVDNVTYSLSDGTYCYWVGDDGLGMAPMHRLSERGPLQDGITDRGYRLDPRPIKLLLEIDASTQSEWESKRRSLLSIFNPTNDAIVLELGYETRNYRIDCHYIGQMEMPSSDQYGWAQVVMVNLLAPDPTYYDPTMNVVYYNMSAGGDTMEVPTEIPMTVGASSISSSKNISNNGDVVSYPQIRIDGPITSCVITNAISGDKLDFTGATITSGHYYDIDCRYGYKTVEDDAGDNKIANLSDDSDLATFAIESGQSVGREAVNNPITVTATGADEDTAITFRYYDRYIGV
jgi:hypothetical protein